MRRCKESNHTYHNAVCVVTDNNGKRNKESNHAYQKGQMLATILVVLTMGTLCNFVENLFVVTTVVLAILVL